MDRHSLLWPADSPFPDPAHPTVRGVAIAATRIVGLGKSDVRVLVERLDDSGLPPDEVLLSLREVHAQALAMHGLALEDMRIRNASAEAKRREIEQGVGEPCVHAALSQSVRERIEAVTDTFIAAERIEWLRNYYRLLRGTATAAVGAREPALAAAGEGGGL